MNNHIDDILQKCIKIKNDILSNNKSLFLLKEKLDSLEWALFLRIKRCENSNDLDNEFPEDMIEFVSRKVWKCLKLFEEKEEINFNIIKIEKRSKTKLEPEKSNTESYVNLIMLMWDFVRNKIFSKYIDKIQIQRYSIIGCSISLKFLNQNNENKKSAVHLLS